MIILLPALLSLFALGLEYSYKNWTWAIPIILCVAIIVGSGAGLYAYWHMTKSAESALVLKIQPDLKSTDTVVSLNYSPTAAAYFYLPGIPVLSYVRGENENSQFTYNLLLNTIVHPGEVPIAKVAPSDIRHSSQFWVINREGSHTDVQSYLTSRCDFVKEIIVSQFFASLWKNCQP